MVDEDELEIQEGAQSEVDELADHLREVAPEAAVKALRRAYPNQKWMGPVDGSTRIDFDIKTVEKLAQLNLTIQEAASFFDVSLGTMERRLREPAYRKAWLRGQSQTRRSIRKKQIEKALNGSDTMLIWMGKQLLGQKDKPDMEIHIHDGAETSISVEDFDRMLEDAQTDVVDAEFTEVVEDEGPDLPQHPGSLGTGEEES